MVGRRFPREDYKDYYEDSDEEFRMLVSGGYMPKGHNLSKFLVSVRTSRPVVYFGDNHFCAGTIIGSRMILTTAHCIMQRNQLILRPRRIYVVAGTSNRLKQTRYTTIVHVSDVIPHAKYVRRGKYDIAILRLTKPLPEQNERVKIIALPSGAPKVGDLCTLCGWGQLYEKGPLSAHALCVDLSILNDSLCEKRFPRAYGKGLLCAGDPNDWERDGCRGDSGGPLICNGKVVGILSWGLPCGRTGTPTIFTDVYYHRKWIQDVNEAVQNPIAICSVAPLSLVLLMFVI